MIESPIQEARMAAMMLRYQFEADKKREWTLVSADARAAVEHAVWAAYEAGVPVSQIAREYGTKSRNTIYDIINHVKESYIAGEKGTYNG